MLATSRPDVPSWLRQPVENDASLPANGVLMLAVVGVLLKQGSTPIVSTVRFLSSTHQQPCAIRASGGSPKPVVRAALGAACAAPAPYMAPPALAPEGDQSLLHYAEVLTLSLSAEIKVLLYPVPAPFSAGIITPLVTQRYVLLCRSRVPSKRH